MYGLEVRIYVMIERLDQGLCYFGKFIYINILKMFVNFLYKDNVVKLILYRK